MRYATLAALLAAAAATASADEGPPPAPAAASSRPPIALRAWGGHGSAGSDAHGLSIGVGASGGLGLAARCELLHLRIREDPDPRFPLQAWLLCDGTLAWALADGDRARLRLEAGAGIEGSHPPDSDFVGAAPMVVGAAAGELGIVGRTLALAGGLRLTLGGFPIADATAGLVLRLGPVEVGARWRELRILDWKPWGVAWDFRGAEVVVGAAW